MSKNLKKLTKEFTKIDKEEAKFLTILFILALLWGVVVLSVPVRAETLTAPAPNCTTKACLKIKARRISNDRRDYIYFINESVPAQGTFSTLGINSSFGTGPEAKLTEALEFAQGCYPDDDKEQCELEKFIHNDLAKGFSRRAKRWCRANGQRVGKCMRDYWRVRRVGIYNGPKWRIR